MEIEELLARANDSIHVNRVFGTPIELGDVVVIPAAYVQGGGGGGSGGGGTGFGGRGPSESGAEASGEGYGSGGGFGIKARPAGAFVLRDGDLDWEPAVDPNRMVLAVAAIGIVGLLVYRSIRRAQIRRGG